MPRGVIIDCLHNSHKNCSADFLIFKDLNRTSGLEIVSPSMPHSIQPYPTESAVRLELLNQSQLNATYPMAIVWNHVRWLHFA